MRPDASGKGTESEVMMSQPENINDKSHRANASQFFIAGELCRRNLVAVVTMGNCPNTDILCSNKAGTAFAHIQVKTFVPGNRTCSVGRKAERNFGKNFFWVLGGIPQPGLQAEFTYYIIPSEDMSRNVCENHESWCKTPGKKGQPHDSKTTVRTVELPPYKHKNGWDLNQYKNRWDLIDKCLQ